MTLRRPSPLPVALAVVVIAAPVWAQGTQCGSAEVYDRLDFWLGEWRVVDQTGEEVGTSRIVERQAGCVIEELWTSARGGSGQSVSFYDPSIDGWRQVWVDGRGVVVRYTGGFRDGAMHLAGEHVRPDGTVRRARVVLEPSADGEVRHLIEHSADGGDSWTVFFDGTYLPIDDPAASESVEASPPKDAGDPASQTETTAPPVDSSRPEGSTASETAEEAELRSEGESESEGRGVVATSERGTEAADRIERMTSPMTLEVSLGPVHEMPAGYGWTTDETARFVVDEVSVREVSASIDGRGDRARLTVGVTLQADRFLGSVDVAVELLAGGEIVAAESLRGVSVGRGVPSQLEGGVEKSARLDIGRDRLAELFEEAPPTVRLTVTVR